MAYNRIQSNQFVRVVFRGFFVFFLAIQKACCILSSVPPEHNTILQMQIQITSGERVPFIVMLHNFLINCVTQFGPHSTPSALCAPTLAEESIRGPLPAHPFHASNLYTVDTLVFCPGSNHIPSKCESLVPPGISIKLSRICSCSYHDFISYDDDCCCWVAFFSVCVCVVRGPSFVIADVLNASDGPGDRPKTWNIIYFLLLWSGMLRV